MPIAVKCSCGSQLEIDEKFLGKEILCPDCQRPLPTKAPVAPPPLDVPEFRRTSGLAVLSLSMSVVGFFTLVGSIAGIVTGVMALKKIKQHSTKLDGARLARAGIIIGAAGLVLTLLFLILPSILVEGYVRDLVYAGRVEFPTSKTIDRNEGSVRIDRPSERWNDWGVYKSPTTINDANVHTDDLILINTHENAFIACQRVTLKFDEVADADHKKKALERLQNSELLRLMARGPFPAERMPTDEKKPDEKGKKDAKNKDDKTEYVFDMRVGKYDRRFLVRWIVRDNGTKLTVLVAAVPTGRFERMEKDIRESFEKATIK